MRLAIVFLSLLSAISVAQAQQPAPPQFVPFTVNEQDARDLRKFLDEQPMKFGLPVLQWIEAKEQQAILAIEKDKAEKAAAEEKVKKQAPLPKD